MVSLEMGHFLKTDWEEKIQVGTYPETYYVVVR